jgi:hypothetical protein
MIRGSVAAPSGLKHHIELRADTRLADEFVESPGPQSTLDRALAFLSTGIDEPLAVASHAVVTHRRSR